MNILGIETSCDETCASIVKDGKDILSSVIYSQIKTHSCYGGVVPEIASRKHIEKISYVIDSSIKKANIKNFDIDAVAVTFGPGLVGCLLVGVNFAKGLCFATKKPLIKINHLKAHVAANYLSNKNLTPPFMALIISGGHSNIVLVKDYCNFTVVGKTVDDAVGEAYDKIGRAMDLNYPAGPEIDRLAKTGNKDAYILPKPNVENKPFCFSFSGLKTYVLNIINNEKLNKNNINKNDICASFQKTVCEILCEKAFSCLKYYNQKKLVVSGGVCANVDIRNSLKKYAIKNNVELYMPDVEYCTDNAAMVASQGYFEYINGNIQKDMSLNACSCPDL